MGEAACLREGGAALPSHRPQSPEAPAPRPTPGAWSMPGRRSLSSGAITSSGGLGAETARAHHPNPSAHHPAPTSRPAHGPELSGLQGPCVLLWCPPLLQWCGAGAAGLCLPLRSLPVWPETLHPQKDHVWELGVLGLRDCSTQRNPPPGASVSRLQNGSMEASAVFRQALQISFGA